MTALSDLVGEFMLDGVDFYQEPSGDWKDDASVCRFRLDGKTYCAIEDPSDGYRSSMAELLEGNADMMNTFPPVRVRGIHFSRDSEEWRSDECDILKLIDMETGEVVLEVGTANTDDYYPSFVASFNPKAMVHNAPAAPPTPQFNATTSHPLFGKF